MTPPTTPPTTAAGAAATQPREEPHARLGTDYILEALAAEGLGHLFMVPGGLVDPFLPALARQATLKPVVAAHEGGAVYMADGYARASGRFGAALAIGGPGSCNMATAVAAAKTDASPVLVMTGEVPLDMEDRGTFQDASQATLQDTAVMAPLTRLSRSVETARNLNHWLRHALTAMWAQPRGPVHLSLMHDALVGETTAHYVKVFDLIAGAEPLSLAPADTALGALAAAKAGRTRIAFLAGAGVEHDAAAAGLKMLAERWSIPVATTLRAKGVFPEDHELSLGVFGYAGTRHATEALLGALDCLIVLGSGLNERDTMHWTLRERMKALMIHVNTDMDELTANGDLGHVVPGSCRAFLELMSHRAPVIGPALLESEAERRAWLAGIRAKPRLYDVENLARATAPIHPAATIRALRKALPRDGIVLVDSGAHRAFAGHYWTAYEPRSYISATNLGPMGWAIPAAVGVQCARPERRVAVITGDGCMQMHGIEVQTAALQAADHLSRDQQWRTRQCLAACAPLRRFAVGAHQHSRSRLGGIWPRAGGARLHSPRSRRPRNDLREGAGRQYDRRRRRQGRQELPDAGLRFQCRRARLVLSRVGVR
jgi:acetolactate synthase I/II/III large subunit